MRNFLNSAVPLMSLVAYCISVHNNIDLAIVFTYPLVPAPPALSHVDGTPKKTDKSKRMNKLESLADNTDPTAVGATFVDAMFLLHSLQDIPKTYGEIAVMILLPRRMTQATTVSQVQIKQGQKIGNVHYSRPHSKQPSFGVFPLNAKMFRRITDNTRKQILESSTIW